MSEPIASLSETLERVECAVVVMDLVESVRLMQDHESTTIRHWLHFTRAVRERLAPALSGRVVKSLGDGMLLTFTSCANAANFALQAISQLGVVVQDLPAAQRLALRIGAHWTSVVVDECDIFGSGVNLSARLAAQSQPNEILVSCEFAEQLLDGVHGQLTDLGERFFKHLSEPVRVLLLGPRAPEAAVALEISLLPTLAFLPLQSSLEDQTMARVLDDHFVSMMATVPHWHVMSRLSTASLAATRTGLTVAPLSVKADLLVRGSVSLVGQQAHVNLELVDARNGEILWEGRGDERAEDLLLGEADLSRSLTAHILAAVVNRQADLVHQAVLPTLPAYALLLGAMRLLHRLGRSDFGRSRDVLEHLLERHPRSAETRAWLGKWHFLQIAQGSRNSDDDARRATDMLDRALDADPGHALSLALRGHLSAYWAQDREQGYRLLCNAVALGPNESLAWLFMSNLHVARGETAAAVVAARRACSLSPLDPMGYYYDVFSAAALSADGQHQEALVAAQRSVRRNCLHLSSWAQLIVSQVLTDRMDDARQSVRKYLEMRPQASVARFVAGHIASGTAHAERDARALLAAGMPP